MSKTIQYSRIQQSGVWSDLYYIGNRHFQTPPQKKLTVVWFYSSYVKVEKKKTNWTFFKLHPRKIFAVIYFYLIFARVAETPTLKKREISKMTILAIFTPLIFNQIYKILIIQKQKSAFSKTLYSNFIFFFFTIFEVKRGIATS